MEKIVKSRICIFSFLFLIGMTTKAQVQVLEVKEKDGTQVFFALNEKPVVRCSNDELNVNCSSGESLSVFLSNVEYFKLTSVASDIAEISASQNGFRMEAGYVYLNCIEARTNIVIYDIKGVVVGRYSSSNDGNAEIDMNSYGNGVYIIKTKAATYKISR